MPFVAAEALAPETPRAFGQLFVIDNTPGASGNLGRADVARAAPDGHRLPMGAVGTHAVNGSRHPRRPLDPVKDFAPSPWSPPCPTCW